MQRALLIFSEDFPPNLLEPTRKTASVFLDLSRETKNSSKISTLFLKALQGPMRASAPTAACANAYEFAENQYKICSALLHDLSDSASPSHLPFQGRLGCGSICFSADTPVPDRGPSGHSGSCSSRCVRPAGLRSTEPDTARGCGHRSHGGRSRC